MKTEVNLYFVIIQTMPLPIIIIIIIVMYASIELARVMNMQPRLMYATALILELIISAHINSQSHLISKILQLRLSTSQ